MLGNLRNEKKVKSPFLKDKPSGTLPKRTPNPYIKDLFGRSDKAILQLRFVGGDSE